MKNATRMIARILMITMIAVFCFAAVPQTASADPYPRILDWSGSRWLYPGQQSVKLHIYLSMPVDKVQLMYNNNGSWLVWNDCAAGDSDMDYWFSTVTQDTAPKPKMEFKYRVGFNGNTSIYYSPTFTVEWTSYRGMERIAGKNRFKTAEAIAQRILSYTGKTKHKYVIVVSGSNYADALSGSYASAVADNAPIYLVTNDPKVIDDTANAVANAFDGTGFVFILGGTGAVPAEFEDALKARGITRIQRYSGKDRYATNMNVLLSFGKWDYDHLNDQIMLCSGKNYADALSASAVGHPIMLVGDELTLDQEAYFMENDPFIYLIGGTGAVSQAIEDEIYYDFGYYYWRLYGKNRFETSQTVADYFFPHQPYNAILAYGMNYPDGLAAGPLAQVMNAPLLLVENNNYMPAEDFFHEHDPRYTVVIGGTSLISDYTADRIRYWYEYAAG